MNATRKIIPVLAVMLMLLVVVAGCQAKQPSKTVKIGFMAPLSGEAASYGLSILKGAQLAVKESNLPNVQLVVEDSKCDPKEAVSAINKLISVDRVQVIVGEVCSGATLAAASIAAQNKVPMISAASTSPEISKLEGVFRTVPSDALQGAFGADLVTREGYYKLAILYSNEEYGLGFNNALEKEFVGDDREVVASEPFDRGSIDLRTQLTKIKAAKPEAIYIIGNSPDSAVAALKQIRELRIQAALFGSEGLKSEDIVKGAGKAAEGLILTTVSGGSEEFAAKHRAAYGSEPGPFAAQAYDAYKAIAMAVEQGVISGEDIKRKLSTLEFDGASGHIKFDASGDVKGNYDVFVVEKGKLVRR